MKLCIKCNEEKDNGLFYLNGKICLRCHKKKYKINEKKPLMDKKIRTCLMCDKKFISTGNRRCDPCNNNVYDEDRSVSAFIRF